jgi:hypothetical protein
MNWLWSVANGEIARTVERSAANIRKLIILMLLGNQSLLKYQSKFIT